MGILRGFYIPFIFLIVIIEATNSDYNETSSNEDRQSRATGRIVKLYSGPKPEPIVCTGEGFQKDPYNCAVFYRCMKSGHGKYTVFRFQCGPGTVYDPETEVCNHPRSTKRSECGGFLPPIEDTTHMNEINSVHNEIPSPIITNRPIYTAKPSIITTVKSPADSDSTTRREITTVSSSPYPWGTPISNIYIDNGATAYPLMPTTVTGIFALAPNTTSNIPHASSHNNICTSDGFMGDTENCHKFYRCVANQRGGYTRYEFSCTETTVWDDDNQICNHVWAVKRSRCGNNIDKINTNILSTNKTIQQPLQINYGSKVTPTQTQFSDGLGVQNKTQIHYGDRINQVSNEKYKQNQTQISHAAAVSPSQTQIDYGNRGMQSQLQIDHSNKATQYQVQMNELSKTTSTPTENVNSDINSTQKNNECTELGFMGDIKDCQKFYRCIDNGRGGYIKYEFSCSDGTVWDQSIEACNHAWAVNGCGSKDFNKLSTQITTTPTYKPTQSYHTTTSTENYQIIPMPVDSEDNDDVGYQKPISMAPLPPSTSTTMKPIPTDDSKKGTDCTYSGFMGDDNDCKIFYRCVENGNGGYIKHQFKCGDGTVWDAEISACNHAWAVKKCGGSTSSAVTAIETTTQKLTTSSPVQVSISTSTEYYQTMPDDEDNGYQISQQKPSSSSTSTTILPTTVNSLKGDGQCTSSGFMGDDKNCQIFYRCVENGNGGYIKHEFKCGDGTVWDPEIEACNHAWAVKKCGGTASWDISETETTTKEVSESTTVPQSSIMSTHSTTQIVLTTDYNNVEDSGYGPAHSVSPITITSTSPENINQQSIICKSSGFIVDKYDCKKFYRCVDNGQGGYISYEFQCSEGTVWDSKIDGCNHYWAVENCGQGTTESSVKEIFSSSATESTQNTTISISHITTTTTEFVSDTTKCTQSGYMPDAKNCNKFYRCVDNGNGLFTKYEYSCGEGTLWDQEIEACNHAWAVTKCGANVSATDELHETTPSYHPVINDEIDNVYPVNMDPDSDSTSTQTPPPVSGPPKESGEGNSCISSGFIGDNNNCKKFYRCVDDGKGGFIRYEFNCGEGTVWDQSIEACNHAWAVKECFNAENSTMAISNETTNPTPVTVATSASQEYPQVMEGTSNTEKETTTMCSEEGFIGDINNCKIFYRCVDNGKGGFTKYEFSCGEGTYWNQEILSCDHITSDMECGEKGSHSTSKAPQYEHDETYTETATSSKDENHLTQKPPVSSGTCTSEGFYGDQEDCKKFYRCVGNGAGGYIKYDFTCGDGTIWDQDFQTCNHGSENCSSVSSSPGPSTGKPQHGDQSTIRTTTEKQDLSSPTSSSATSNLCDSEGFFADPNDCRMFIRCVKNDKGGFTKYQFTCAEGTTWVQEMLACDHDTSETQCSSQTVNKPVIPESNQQTTEKSSTTVHVLEDEQDNNYQTSSKPSSESDICYSEGYYGNKNNCRKYYRCVDNGNGGYTKYDFTCSEGTAWDSNIQGCNHIDQVPSCQGSVLNDEDSPPTTQSSGTSSSMSTASSTTQKTTDSTKPSSGSNTEYSQDTETCDREGFFGNTQDCKKFYRCVDNGNGGYIKYDFTCAEGTIWDKDLTTCNHPGDVANPSCNSTDNGSTTQEPTSDNSSSGGSSSSTTERATQEPSQDGTSKKPDNNNNVNCTKAGFYPNPNDCKKFYRCVDWDGDGTKFSVFHFECGEGTIWDPAIETCNHEESVYPPRNCTGSQSQDGSQSSTTESTSSTTQESTPESTTSTTTEQSLTSTEPTSSTTTEQPEEGTTDKPNENTTESAGEGTTEKKEETTTENSGETTTEKSNESTTQQSSVETTEKPGPSTTEQSVQETTDEQEESTTEQPGEGTTEQSVQSTTEQGAQSTTEKSDESTTGQSGEGTTEKSEQSTTEQTTEGTTENSEGTTGQTETSTTERMEGTTQEASNTESSTTEHSSTEETSSENSTTEQSITEGSSTTESETETSTNANAGDKECPETEEDQYLFVCPSSFRRHPKYCNLFYQCDENEETHDLKVAVFTCPNGTIYDESQIKCVEESKADKKCDGEIAQKRRFKRRNRIGDNDPIVVTKDSHACPAAGYYAFEKDGDCSPGFLKCKRNKSNKLRALVYQCPEGYIFWSVSRRCERIDRVSDCRRSVLNSWNKRWEIPIENRNVAWA